MQALSELLPSDNNPGWAAEALTALGRSHNYSNLRGAAPFEEMPSITQAGLSSNCSSPVVFKASCTAGLDLNAFCGLSWCDIKQLLMQACQALPGSVVAG